MLTLIITVAFGILIAIFAVQNRNLIDIRFGTYVITGMPVYLVILASVLLTLIFSGILFVINNISTFFTLHRNDNSKKVDNENVRLNQKINDLEKENAKLKERAHNAPQSRPGFFPIGR